jgi:hypothetical protein
MLFDMLVDTLWPLSTSLFLSFVVRVFIINPNFSSMMNTVSGTEMYFFPVLKKVQTTVNPHNKTGWSYENQPSQEATFDRWIRLCESLPSEKGTLVFFELDKSGSLTLLKTLNHPTNIRRAMYSLTNPTHLQWMWSLLNGGAHKILVQLAKAS